MSTRARFLFVSSLLVVAVVAGATSVRASAPTPANDIYTPQALAGHWLYLPLVQRGELPLSQIVGLAVSCCDAPYSADFNSEIYTLRADGSDVRRLTNNNVKDAHARWSPDGSFILWQQYPLGTSPGYYGDVWVMNSDGTNPHDIGEAPGHESAQWSPTANLIALGVSGSLYVTAPAAFGLTLVADQVDFPSVLWSPTGDYIAFIGNGGLYAARSDGSNVKLVASSVGWPVGWSPDGVWLVYQESNAASRDLYVAHPDGSGARALVTGPLDDYRDGWVENGARMLVRHYDSTAGASSIDLVSLADGTSTPFIRAAAGMTVEGAGISPDGQQVAYYESSMGRRRQLKLQRTSSDTPAAVSPLFECTAPSCDLVFAGYSDDGSQLAYWRRLEFGPFSATGELYAANVQVDPPTYWLLDPSGLCSAWLPGSPWLSAYVGHRLQLYNPGTGAVRVLPSPPEEGAYFGLQEWRYQP